jgi:hypothetical protein
MKATAKKTFYVGSLKNGMIEVKMGEQVYVVKTTEKSLHILKDGKTKQVSKNLFY